MGGDMNFKYELYAEMLKADCEKAIERISDKFSQGIAKGLLNACKYFCEEAEYEELESKYKEKI
jgi:hypothetical protein